MNLLISTKVYSSQFTVSLLSAYRSSEHLLFFNEPCLVWPGRRMATSLAWPPSTAPPRAYWPATQAGNTSQHRVNIKDHHDSDISMAILKNTQNTKLKLNKRVVVVFC